MFFAYKEKACIIQQRFETKDKNKIDKNGKL